MNTNELTINKFYSAFQKRDFRSMQECYADTATFSDAVFQNLDSKEVKAMWEMLCLQGKDLQLEFKNIWADENAGKAEWIATYTFSATGRKVVNRIQAEFWFENGKIVKHFDTFDFYAWAKQALGFTGFLLGWTPFLQSKIQKKAMQNLAKFIAVK